MHSNGTHSLPVGIDDLSAYVPQLFLPIETLAQARDIPFAKLNKGLGLEAMSLTDAREDTATMAANAVLDLMHKNDLSPQQVGRIYLGTESALDGAKPTATYVVEMLQDHFELEHGPNCFLNCDVVDMTFACIGAVDALENTLDWVRADRRRVGIVVASDRAIYELGSGGEYTQGAGAIAVLVRANPRLLTIEQPIGVATRAVHDFFKPVRRVRKVDLVREILELTGQPTDHAEALVARLDESIEVRGIIDANETELSLHKATPVFDGPYSNDCYQARISEALKDYRRKAGLPAKQPLLQTWKRLVFHLPYAYQARRMFSEVFMDDLRHQGQSQDFVREYGLEIPCADTYNDRDEYLEHCADFLRAVTKTPPYREFVAEKIERGERASAQIGNLYTGSIFLALMSTLEADCSDQTELTGEKIAFFAYGSGSKSKVFTGTVQAGWREVCSRFGLEERLAQRQAIDYATYEQLHRGQLRENVAHHQAGSFFLADISDGLEDATSHGARLYGYRAQDLVEQ
jgi:hydroxymethylglutaryl-CoA synthase